MDTTVAAITITAVTLLFNIVIHVFGGGTRLSAKLSAMTTTLETVTTTLETVQSKIEKFGDILISMADIRGEINVLANRVTHVEEDMREIRHGEGFVRGARGIDKEYP